MMNEVKVFFSPATALFYDADIYGDQLPQDAIEITEDLRQQLLESQSLGKQIVAGKNGQPLAVERPGPTFEQQVERERFWRDSLLTKTDTMVTRHRDEQDAERATTLTTAQYQQMQAYRLDLRDWPTSRSFPSDVHRPVPPGWLAALT
jgi:hypothetical protein